ncbi:MAG: YciI family protein [Dongiaceae bacterium]
MRDTATGAPAGGLWLVEADDPAAVTTLYQGDPFWPTGLRRSVRILGWSRVSPTAGGAPDCVRSTAIFAKEELT